MATGAVLGNGTRVGYSPLGSPVAWTRIPQVLEVDFPSESPDKVDKTVHGTSKYKANFPGMVEVGDLTVRCLADFDEVTSPIYGALQVLHDAQTEIYWRVEIPTNRAQSRFKPFELYGYIGEVTIGVPIDDKQTIAFSIVHSGTGISRYATTGSPSVV